MVEMPMSIKAWHIFLALFLSVNDQLYVASFSLIPSGVLEQRSILSKAILRKQQPVVLSSSPLDDFDDEDEDPMKEWKEAYPELEFVNYNDPEYKVDQGEEMNITGDETEARIEEMREERRRLNDEFQFETYFRDVLESGGEFKGEWTVYKAMFDELDMYGMPQLRKAKNILKVVSKGDKVVKDQNAEWRVDGEYIFHEEVAAIDQENDMSFAETILSQTYFPKELKAFDFRGPAGIMKVGNGHTICQTVPLNGSSEDDTNDGPFSEMRTEVGIHHDDIRLRLKLDYRASETDSDNDVPPLLLNTVIVCRERLNAWPRKEGFAPSEKEIALFGPPGAKGGLYDPPPIENDEQAAQYMMQDLQGGATILFPFKINQSENMFDGKGWVTTLDWSPGAIRYQVDRKVNAGKKVKGLKTLELTEVETEEANRWRPRDGGANMRQ